MGPDAIDSEVRQVNESVVTIAQATVLRECEWKGEKERERERERGKEKENKREKRLLSFGKCE